MKKRLFLLPLIGAFTLAGCSFEDLMFWKKKEDSSKKTPSGGEVVPGGDEDPTEETFKPTDPTAPSGMSLVASVSGYGMKDLAFKGYDACKGDHTVGSYTVNFNGAVQINGDPAGANPKDGDKKYFNVIQFAKVGHAKAAEGGTLLVKSIQASKVIVQAFIKTSYSWNASQLGTVTMGGSAVTVPSTSTTETTEYNSEWQTHNVTLDLNGSGAADFSINNSNSFAIYIASINFYA